MKRFSFWKQMLLLVILVGCAKERDPVDRVQPYALDKSFFVGSDLSDASDDPEFYSRNHIIDVGYGAIGASNSLFTSNYAEPVGRIRWQITEDFLIARAAYERIEGSDGKGDDHFDVVGKPTNDGVVVATFAIDSHFDITNDYNPTTGEKLNVIVENDADRPWFERQYMRVDWSKNLNTDSYDFDTLSFLGVLDGVEYEPVAYLVADPQDDDAPHFDFEDGYFDVTTKAFAKPKDIDISRFGWGSRTVPACFLSSEVLGGTAPVGSCNPVEITLRHSFVRLDRDGDGIEESDYEPREYDGQRFEHFGGFYHERYGYDRRFGLVDEKTHRLLNRYNIWRRSHYYSDEETMTGEVSCDSNEDRDNDGTADQCVAVSKKKKTEGSQCDLFKQRCTLPYRSREPVPIPFYYTDTSNPFYFEATELAVHEWDVALRSAVRTARYTECVQTSGNDDAARTTCREQHPMWRGQMDDQQDAVALSLEVDDCRMGRAHKQKNRKNCEDLAEEIGKRRCVNAGKGRRCVSDAVRDIAKMPEMLALCHSPVTHDDPALCGEKRMPKGATFELCKAVLGAKSDEASAEQEKVIAANDEIGGLSDLADACKNALRVRMGDLRYHVINVMESPQTPSPWGIMVSSIDPLTGENIATNCNVWSHVTDKATQKVVDQMRFAKGELSSKDVTEAEYIATWVNAAEAAANGGVFGTLPETGLSSMLSTFATGSEDPSFRAAAKQGRIGDQEITAELLEDAMAIDRQVGVLTADSRVTDPGRAVVEARKNAARGSEFEAALTTRAMLQKAGVDNLPLDDAVLEQASPLRGGDPKIAQDLKQMMENVLHRQNTCLLDAEMASLTPLALMPLADIMEEKFGKFNPDDAMAEQYERAERMRQYLAHKLHYGVIAHEIGHSVAHRHNFVGSANPWAYSPQYWQLRTQDGAVDQSCDGVQTDGEDCVGPRYLDPVTPSERDNLIHMFMTSSVMDYQGEITQDFMGPGIWDFAATRMFYGDVVSVVDDREFELDGNRLSGIGDAVARGFGGLRGVTFNTGSLPIHYTDLQRHYKMIRSCGEVTDLEAFIPGRYDTERFGDWHPVVDGRMVAPRGAYTRCRQPEVDYVGWRQIGVASGLAEPDPKLDPRDGDNRVMQPYTFGTDNWADIGNVSVYRHDNGADLFEIFNFLITQKELGYVFDQYRRGRADFSVRSAFDRMLTRYDTKIRDGAKGLGLYRSRYREYAREAGLNSDVVFASVIARDEAIASNIVASTYAFDFFARELVRPEAGSHNFGRFDEMPILRYNDNGDITGAGIESGTAVVIPNGPLGAFGMMTPGGELLENRLAEDRGEFDSEYTLNAGSYYNKIVVPMLLTESVDNFISSERSDFYDPRWRSVSMASLFPDGYRRLMANALTNDIYLTGPRLAADSDGNPLVMPQGDPYPAQPIGWTSWWGESPFTCFPVEGHTGCGGFLGGTWAEEFEASVPVDPQIGWEQQKFLIAFSLLFLPENEKSEWLNRFMIYEMGKDPDPELANRVELHHPDGRAFVAQTFGKETIFGKTVQKGIAARVLEYANTLLAEAYETEGVDYDGDGVYDWYSPLRHEDGTPIVRYRADMESVDDEETCNETTNEGCTCKDSRPCRSLTDYMSVPAFLRQAIHAYNMGGPYIQGIF